MVAPVVAVVTGGALHVVNAGRLRYADGLDMQERLHASRLAGEVGDTLILCEHEPVFTLGVRGKADHLLAARDELARRGVDVHQVDRGGDVTYHGPGQLVGYGIVHLDTRGLGAGAYMRALVDVMRRVAAAAGVTAGALEGFPGLWIDDARGRRKLGAVGVRVRRGITTHGFALNINIDPAPFGWIVPCGIREYGVTRLVDEGARADAGDLCDVTARAFAEVLGYTQRLGPPDGFARPPRAIDEPARGVGFGV